MNDDQKQDGHYKKWGKIIKRKKKKSKNLQIQHSILD